MPRTPLRISAYLAALLIGLSAATAVRAVTFDPNNIISDAEMTDAGSMSLAEIDAFLKSQGGYISRNRLEDAGGTMRSGAEIIYNAANNYDCEGTDVPFNASRETKAARCRPAPINPKLLLVLLQKEQSLIEEKNPTQRQLDWANGYGCPDGGGCNDRWRGFGRQVNSASLQFSDYLSRPHYYTYRAGNTYTITNTGRPAQLVTPQNQATAALYNYTPHVYNGNFNFFKLWMRYFTRTYPNNTLLQAKGEGGVWLIQNGLRRPFLSKGALTSRYDPKKIVQVPKADLEKYEVGLPIKFPQYSLVRSPRGTVFLLVDDIRRGFDSAEALRKVGVNPEEIVNASWDDINAYSAGKNITATTTHPFGALLQDKTTGGIFYAFEGTKAPLWDKVLLKTKFRGKVIIKETPERLATYKTVEPAIFSDGELLKADGLPGVYVIDNGAKRVFTSGELFESLGYKWENIIPVPKKIIDLYPDGDPMAFEFDEADIDIVDPGTASTSDETATDTPDSTATTPEPEPEPEPVKTQEEIDFDAELEMMRHPEKR